MATYIPLESTCLPIEMLVTLIARDFPELAQDCDQILDEPDIPRELKEEEVKRTIQLYQMRLEAGLIETPPQQPFLKTSLMKIIRKKFL